MECFMQLYSLQKYIYYLANSSVLLGISLFLLYATHFKYMIKD